jgi:signal transduction histidine kinase
MKPRTLLDFLFPQDERDPRFRKHLDDLSLKGLRTAATIGVAAPLLMWVLGVVGIPGLLRVFPPERLLISLLLGLVPLGISFVRGAASQARLVGVVAGTLLCLESVSSLWATVPDPIRAAMLLNGKVTLVLLVGVMAFPMKPVHAALMGLLPAGVLYEALRRAGLFAEPGGEAPLPVVGLVVATLICTALTATLYRERASAYRARRAVEESFEELREAQARLLVSENALSLGRFAAALSHELNSPIGALGSAVETILALHHKADPSFPADRRQDAAQEASRSARLSLDRLRETVNRMKHLSNLDRAEVQMVDLNELWTELVGLLGGELRRKADVKLELKPIPKVRCRPQQLTAVFSNLLRNAAAGIDRTGTIQITSDRRGTDVVLQVKDDGRGIPAERLSRLFDPTFRKDGGRVGTSWGLFVSRSIITEHGGELVITSEAGSGTIAKIVLPLAMAGAA